VRGITTLEQRSAGAAQALRVRLPKISIAPFFETKVDRGGNYASWEQSVVSRPNALAYVDPSESGEENIMKIVAEKKLNVPVISWDAPEEIRTGIRDGQVLAAIPPKFFANTYVAVYLTAKYLLEGKRMPTGWVEVPITEVNPSNIADYIKAFSAPNGLATYNKPLVDRVISNIPATLPPISKMDHSK
jgi:ribose transport system substrate-binding protein